MNNSYPVLDQRYDQDNWKQFLSDIFVDTRLLEVPETLTDIDTHIASQVQKLGYITLDDDGVQRQIVVYEVVLAPGIVLERNRVGLRNLPRKYWKDMDAAFIAYHRPGSANWRFTYVSELTGYDATGEFMEIKTEPKRYTYVLGEGESTRTATERFATIATKTTKITLDDVKEAFSVEKLSHAFFKEYEKQYTAFCNYMLEQPGIKATLFNGDEKAIRDFSKKLLGRIVFLYFIQKKGWLGVPAHEDWGKGNRNFMTQQFKSFRDKDLFYTNFLSVLFFETLNCKRPNDLFQYDNSQFITPNPDRIKIPYLNGGLFEEDDKKHRNLVFDGKLFENLFDFFNQYNFTIYEDDPTDHTVAVDPEMLGHIFENLLEDNKISGAFYTPREIVHYMCQESLIHYLITKLKIDDEELKTSITNILTKKEISQNLEPFLDSINTALDTVKICDPAIGSGAFPMGLLHEIFTAKQTLHYYQYSTTKPFDASAIKLNIIQNSIYGVDIEKGAVDIARLRFWLSLIVDEQIPKALPNLDYKIVVGNSLISKLGDDTINIDWKIDDTAHGIFGAELAIQKGDLLRTIKQQQKEFFSHDSNKKKIATNIRTLKIDLLITQLQLKVENIGLKDVEELTKNFTTKQIERKLENQGWKNSIQELQHLKNTPELPLQFFDWKLDFPEILNEIITPKPGFDIVIGNPPYIQLQKNGGKLAKMFEKCNFQSYEKTGDIYALFYEKSIDLLKPQGLSCFITSNKWMRAGYGETLRQVLATQNPLLLLDLGPGVFESATVDSNILLLQKYPNQQKTIACITKEKGMPLRLQTQKNGIATSFTTSDSWVIMNPMEQSIKQKIERMGTPLKDWDINIYRGILTGFNEAFIIDGAKKEELLKADSKSAEIIRPILRGRDIKRYGYVFADLWLINTHNGVKQKNINPININDFPAIKNHLDNYYPELEKRLDKGITPYNLRNCAYMEDFYKQKIVWAEMTNQNAFIWDDMNLLTNQTCYFIPNSSKYLLAILNSKCTYFYFSNFAASLGDGAFRWIKQYVEQIPIPVPSKEVENKLEVLVNKIISSNGSDTTVLETAIDEIIYKMFELSEEEIKFIKGI